ncbi:MAG TPA: hypothetical protein VES65_11605 [Solirubrobacteraceae bacterium]|nr:hypothetical protein [Solirubrobacteraceae bacterium]
MQSAFPVVVFGAVGLSVVMSIVFLVSKGSLYDQIGQGGLTGEGEQPGGRPEGSRDGSAAGARATDPPELADSPLVRRPELERSERELEIRQMVQARSERLVRRGEPGLDVDAEVARLTAIAPASAPRRDEGIAQEVLQLVVARNERRERQGLEPLDIEDEVARTLAELDA